MTRIEPLGDRAFLARFAHEDDAAAWAESLRQSPPPGVVDVVTAYQTVGVYTDARLDDLDALEQWLGRWIPRGGVDGSGRLLTIPVCYEGADLPAVAQRLGLTPAEVIQAHGSKDYRVFALGFQAGFPYAGYLPETIAGLPRLEVPRTIVPAGSVAIVGKQTAVYPSATPGGWHLIGVTPVRIVDAEEGFFPIRAGDRLRFVPIDRLEFDQRLGERLKP